MAKITKRPIEAYACFAILIVMTVVMFAGVIWRYVFNSSIVWAEELARYLFVWFVFLSASYAVISKAHIRVEALNAIIPLKIRPYINLIGSFVWLLFSLYIAYLGFQYSFDLWSQNTNSAALKLPMGLVYMGIPLGYLLMAIRVFVVEIYQTLTNRKEGEV
ncbi:MULTISPECIES: TRAP transporter small permease [Lysinibacillus]|uniref:TRAP transporter small permease n=1 Tax=Lysinibacillus antri TaxID=2498145 RepID=A0A3S0P3N5_9BACI|nr:MULTISPECIES: TRAP transporter small permease [Lysinibacillus]RUL47778.1 TRAP transporter small permease [Lysinibacillus antri]TSI08325.1 TRAP transporter small permease [Lysinibacillus sp. BW-2-10]